MISTRQEKLLTAIIKEYTATAKPVSSSQLVDQERLDISTATVRHDMVELESDGWLQQPHTSAGRVPTEQAWRWFVKQVTPEFHLGKRAQEQLHQVTTERHESDQEMLRQLAKTLAEIVDETVLVAFDKTDTYYTGLSNLFQQPEFADIDMLQNLSRVVDHLDEVMSRLYEQVNDRVKVMVGKDNPFSNSCGTLLARYHFPASQTGVLGILGPLRQDYREHMAIMSYTQSLLQKL